MYLYIPAIFFYWTSLFEKFFIFFMLKKLLKISQIAIFFSILSPNILFGEVRSADSIQAVQFQSFGKAFWNGAQYDSALVYFDKSSEMWKSLGHNNKFLEVQSEIANILLRKSDYTKATELLLSAEQYSITNQLAEIAEMGSIYISLGYCHLIREEFVKAEDYTTKGIKIISNHFGLKDKKIASAYYTLAAVQRSQGKYDDALINAERALQIQIELFGIQYALLSNTYILIGSIFEDKNEFDIAIFNYKKAIDIFELSNRITTSDAGVCYLQLMSAYNEKGEYQTAINYGNKAIEIYTAIALPEHANVAATYGKLGEIYTTLGDYEKAKEYLLRSIDIFTSKRPHKKSALGALNIRLGDVYKKIGEIESAISHSQKGIILHEQAYGEYHPQVGFMYEQLAGVYVDAGRFNEAIVYYQKAITARERVVDAPSRNDIAQIYISIANVYTQKKRFDSSSIFLLKAKNIQERSIEKNSAIQSLFHHRSGDLSFAQRKYQNALSDYHSAIQFLTQQNDSVYTISDLRLDVGVNKLVLVELIEKKAKTLEQLYLHHRLIHHLKSAFAQYSEAMNVVDNLRREYFSEGSKLQLAQFSSSVYRNACRIAIQLYKTTNDRSYLEQAFLAADRSKGNVLLEKLIAGDAKYFSGIPDSLLAKEQELQTAIVRYENQLAKAGEKSDGDNSIVIADVRTQYFNTKQHYQTFVEAMESRYPKYYELKYARYSLTVKELQHHLEPETAMLEYLVDDNQIYVFVISQNSIDVAILNNVNNIKALAQKFSTALKTYNTETFCTTGYALYSALFNPLHSIAAFARSSTIKIVPDAFLFYVPFEALPVKRYASSSVDFTKLQYVISRYTVTYSYSAAFNMKLAKQQSKNNSTQMSFAGFAPVFRDSTKNGDFFANRSYVEESGLSDVRSITLDGRTFNELKYSEEEVVSISKTFVHQAIPTKSFLHTQATERNFKTFAPQYDIVHVATHGFINEKNPNLSAVLFSQPRTAAEEEDGILYLNETFALNLKAQLVVLSSCESGVGKLIDGEGMIALSRGLFYAGAKNIIFSLWKVSDKQTYLLMDELYKNIISGKSYSSSLRSAKLSLIAAKETAFPGKWSGFVLVGR